MKKLLVWCLMLLMLLPGAGLGEEAEDALYPIRDGEKWGYMNRAGETVIPPQWRYAERFHDGVAVVSEGPDADLPRDELCGLIDTSGRYILEPEYQAMGFNRFLEPGDGGKMAYYNPGTGYLSPFCFGELFWGWTGELLIYALEEGPEAPYGFLDPATGEAVTPPIFDGLYDDVGCSEGYILAAYERGRQGDGRVWGPDYHLYTRDMEEILFPEGIALESGVHDGVLVVRKDLTDEEADAKGSGWGVAYGLARADGKVILPPQFDYIASPSATGCGRVSFLDHDLVGVLDLEGNVIVPAKYDIDTGGAIPQFCYRNGYAVFRDSATDREIILDTAGREVYTIPDCEEEGGHVFCNVMPGGFFWHYRTGPAGEEAYTLMKIENGQAVCLSDTEYEDVDDYFAPCQEDAEDGFLDGLHPVKLGGQWGYIDRQGKMVIPPQWDHADAFCHGLALVEKDGKLAYINLAGETVWREE